MTGTGQATSFLVDSPERLDEDSDAFGHRDYAQAVAQTLTDAPAPFAVGIFGPWGVGKSTIIGEVRRRLPDHVGFPTTTRGVTTVTPYVVNCCATSPGNSMTPIS